MRDIIKRILREEFEEDNWDELNIEDRIALIEKRKEYVLKVIPKMIKFFEKKYSGYIEKIEIDEHKVFLGSEQYVLIEPVMNFYFSELPDKTKNGTRREIYTLVKDLFNIDIRMYAMPFNIEVYRKKWEKV